MRAWRDRSSWLVVLYLLTTLLVGGGHGHSHGTTDRVQVGCNDARAGLAGHSAPDTGRPADPCPACQVRAQIPFWQDFAATTTEQVVVADPPATTPIPIPGTPSPTRPRAPPSR